MIGSVRGALLDRAGAGEVIVEVSGMGYRVSMAPAASVGIGEIGEEVFVHVHHHQREDGQTLFGFATREERVAFEALIGAHGVGPALAMAILSVHEPRALQQIVAEGDIEALCLVPGVGKKTAQRLQMELKSALDLPDLAPMIDGQSDAGGSGDAAPRADVREALSGLGYGADEVAQVLGDLPSEGDASDLLRQALQRLAVG